MDWFDSIEAAKYPVIEQKPWMQEKRFELVTAETLDRVIQECIDASRYALDIEGTGLDLRVFSGRTLDRIVGYCLSPDGVVGYYIPIRHQKDGSDHNVPQHLVEDGIERLIQSGTKVIFHGAKYDHQVLQYNNGKPLGTWDDHNAWEDTLILAYLQDSRGKGRRGLKAQSLNALGMEMIELKELFRHDHGSDLDFSLLDPSRPEVLWYAASDAICTYLLYDHLEPLVLSPESDGQTQRITYGIEKKCLTATRWMETARLKVDRAKAKMLMDLGQREYLQILGDIYRESSKILGRDVTSGTFRFFKDHFDSDDALQAQIDYARKRSKDLHMDPFGYIEEKLTAVFRLKDGTEISKEFEFPLVYDITKPEQIGLMLQEMKIPGLRLTDSGKQIKTSKDDIESLAEKHGHSFPFLMKIKRFREIQKAVSSYLVSLVNDPHESDDTIKIKFNQMGTDTGRYTTPKGKPSEGGTGFNLHGLPAGYDKSRPECMLRLRECIIAREGKVMVAIDYSGVELRIVTNLSYEPKWLVEYFRCSGCDFEFEHEGVSPAPPPPFCPSCGSDKIGDLHSLTSMNLWPDITPDHPDFKNHRQMAKSVNFALCYGGGPLAVQRSTGLKRNEASRVKQRFDGGYGTLKRWWAQQHSKARQHSFVRTAFNRKYPLPDINHEDSFYRSKAERNAVNGPVQGTSADITKIAMGEIYLLCKERGWLEKVLMILTIHDELVFEIDEDILEVAVDALMHVMVWNKFVKAVRWRIPLTVDCEIGFDWSVPWNLTKIRHGKVKPPKRGESESESEYQSRLTAWEEDWVLLEGRGWWPKKLVPFFPLATKESEALEDPSREALPTAPGPLPSGSVRAEPTFSPGIQEIKMAPAETPSVIADPTSPPGGNQSHSEVFEYRLRSAPTPGMIQKLVRVIESSVKGPGRKPLRILGVQGDVLFEDPSLRINPEYFRVLVSTDKDL